MKDVLFVVGGSSVYHYNTAMTLLPEIVQKQQTSSTLFSLIRYADMASLEIPFKDKRNFVKEVAQVYWTGKGDTLTEALDLAPGVFSQFGRPKAERVLVVFASNDESTPRNELVEIDMKLTKDGIRVIPVVVGEPTGDGRLTEIHPKKKMPISVKPGDDSKDSTDKISEVVFKGLYDAFSLYYVFVH